MFFYQKIIKVFYGLMVFIFLLIGSIFVAEFQHLNLAVYFFDVGQGDSILIYTPKGQTILIDGGVDNTVVYKLGKYLPFYNRNIDLIISTHPDSDHLAGLLEVINRYHVKNILFSGIEHNSYLNQLWLEKIKQSGANLIIANQPLVIPLNRNMALKILYPSQSLFGQTLKESNDASIVAKLDVGNTAFLFTGDAPSKTVEKNLLTKGVDLQSDVLKVGHHGSKYSSGAPFLAAVKPKIAIISAGKDNKFGHPNPEVIARLNHLGATILSTINLGDIIIYSDGV